MDKRRIRDVIGWESEQGQIEEHLRSISEAIDRTAEWIIVSHPRDERNAALLNLLEALPPYDWIEILDGFIGLAEPGDPRTPILEQERKRISDLRQKSPK